MAGPGLRYDAKGTVGYPPAQVSGLRNRVAGLKYAGALTQQYKNDAAKCAPADAANGLSAHDKMLGRVHGTGYRER